MKRYISKIIVVLVALVVSVQASAKGPPWRAALLTDANGVEIGRVIGMDNLGLPYALTDRGYSTVLRRATGTIWVWSDGVYYEDAYCQSEVAYQPRGRFLGTVFSPTPDIENTYATHALLYSPPDAQLATVDIHSMSIDPNTGCEQYEEIGFQGYPAYANDPTITGIENTPYQSNLVIK